MAVVTNANCSVVSRDNTSCVLMAYKTNANIPWQTFEGTPFDLDILVLDIGRIGENSVVARKAAAFEFLWRIIVDTERAFFIPPSTGIWRRLTFIDFIVAVAASEAVGAFQIVATEILTIVSDRNS
jgi:hypothetical protein